MNSVKSKIKNLKDGQDTTKNERKGNDALMKYDNNIRLINTILDSYTKNAQILLNTIGIEPLFI